MKKVYVVAGVFAACGFIIFTNIAFLTGDLIMQSAVGVVIIIIFLCELWRVKKKNKKSQN